MSSDVEQQIRADRIAKVEALRRSGVEPYPARTPERAEVEAVRAGFGELEAGAESGQSLWVAGRISGRRGHGKAIFLDLTDRTGRLQLHATLDALGEEGLAAVSDCDLGDVVAVHGDVFCSRRGELSLRVREWRPLAKCLRPLPEKHHGLADVEQRHRQRYLDLLVNDEARRIALARPALVTAMRAALDGDGFVEVETPVLQPIYGGGAARPFVTFYNEFERDFYLRIADELYLKRLIVGGLERVYEIGKDFRNESVSFKRNPEFSMLEWYEAYADYEGGMQRTERVVAAAGAAAGAPIDLTPPWPRVPLRQAIADADRHRPHGRPRPRPAGGVHARAGARHVGRRDLGAGRRPSAVALRRAEPRAADVPRRLPGRAVAVRQAVARPTRASSSGSRPSAWAWRSPTATPS